MTDEPARVRAMGPGTYRVARGDRGDRVYVAGDAERWWAFWKGRVYSGGSAETIPSKPVAVEYNAPRPRAAGALILTAPMPARVLEVRVSPGDRVIGGETLVLLEAMKMELPVLAPADSVVRAVLCEAGQLVQPEAPLVELTPDAGAEP